MFRRNKQTTTSEITHDERQNIIEAYLKQIAPAYKDQDITAERMIEMELTLIEKARS